MLHGLELVTWMADMKCMQNFDGKTSCKPAVWKRVEGDDNIKIELTERDCEAVNMTELPLNNILVS
jgi:hypothetical protein